MPPAIPAPATPGTVAYVPFARFTYNALGHRTSAVYDLNRPVPPAGPQADPFADETIEWLVYDPSWRVVATYLQFPALPGQTTRPQPKLHERYVYHMQGVGVSGSAAKLDSPILRQRDTNGDGLLTAADQTIYYMQNVRGDVVCVAAADGKLLEFVGTGTSPSGSTTSAHAGNHAAGLRPYGGEGGGHHVGAQSAFRGAANYDADRAPPISNAEMDRLGLDHKVISKKQSKLYRSHLRTGQPLTWDDLHRIESESFVAAGMNRQAAEATVTRAFDELKSLGVAGPTCCPYGDP